MAALTDLTLAQARDGLAAGEVAVAEGLEDAARDGVVAADRHGPRPCKRSALSRLP